MSYQRFRDSLRTPALIAVAEYWASLRRDGRLPAWRDIDPAALKPYLPIVWAWRWDAEAQTFIGRLAGEEIVAVMGMSNRGKRFADCFPASAAEVVLARFRRIVDEPSVLHAQGKVYLLAGGEGWGERIALPLADDGIKGDCIFGATVYRLGIRPKIGEAEVDHLSESTEFYPLGVSRTR